MGFGLTPLLGDRRGFMPPQLKTKQNNNVLTLTVKSKVKISSIFVALLENMNFKQRIVASPLLKNPLYLSNPIVLSKNKELVLVVKVTIWYIAQWWRLGSCVWWKIILSMES